jgi:hypothetical protein
MVGIIPGEALALVFGTQMSGREGLPHPSGSLGQPQLVFDRLFGKHAPRKLGEFTLPERQAHANSTYRAYLIFLISRPSQYFLKNSRRAFSEKWYWIASGTYQLLRPVRSNS